MQFTRKQVELYSVVYATNTPPKVDVNDAISGLINTLRTKVPHISTTTWFQLMFLGMFGAIFGYSQYFCGTEMMPLGQEIHEGMCCHNCSKFSMGDLDRKIHVALAFLGVFGNVVPKYAKKDEADRHLAAMKANPFTNTLIVHIISGIATVLGAGLFGVFGFEKLIPVFTFGSIVHDLSIHGLLPNHDGIFAIRVGNFALAAMKTIVVCNVADPIQRADLLFFLAFGFMGTRIACTVVYILQAVSFPASLIDEYWYSFGLSTAQFYIYSRMWSSFNIPLFMAAVCTTALYYHKRWRADLHIAAIGVFVLLLAVGLNVSELTRFLVTCGAYIFTFFLPFWRRQRLSLSFAAKKEEDVSTKSTGVPTVEYEKTIDDIADCCEECAGSDGYESDMDDVNFPRFSVSQLARSVRPFKF